MRRLRRLPRRRRVRRLPRLRRWRVCWLPGLRRGRVRWLPRLRRLRGRWLLVRWLRGGGLRGLLRILGSVPLVLSPPRPNGRPRQGHYQAGPPIDQPLAGCDAEKIASNGERQHHQRATIARKITGSDISHIMRAGSPRRAATAVPRCRFHGMDRLGAFQSFCVAADNPTILRPVLSRNSWNLRLEARLSGNTFEEDNHGWNNLPCRSHRHHYGHPVVLWLALGVLDDDHRSDAGCRTPRPALDVTVDADSRRRTDSDRGVCGPIGAIRWT